MFTNFENFLNETYKKTKFVSEPVKVGDIFYAYDVAKPGYYNYRKVKSIDDDEDICEIEICDSDGRIQGSSFPTDISYVQKCKDKSHQESHDKEETRKELSYKILKKVGMVKGGDLNDKKVVIELNKVLNKLKNVCEEYKQDDSSIPSAPNSMTFRASRSGTPVSISYNDVHRGDYYAGSTPFVVQVKVGGGIKYEISSSILQTAKEILSKYTFETELGKSRISETSGTNWSSVMITAPYKYQSGGGSYSIINIK